MSTEPEHDNGPWQHLDAFLAEALKAQAEINQKLQDQVASLVDLAVDLMVRVEVLESQVKKESASGS